MAKAQVPLVKSLKSAEQYFIAEANALRSMRGTPWIFLGIAVMIDYLATLEKGGRADRDDYISIIRRKFPSGYRKFKYTVAHRKAGTGQAIKTNGKVTGHKKKTMTVLAQDMRLFSLVLLFLINFGTPVNALDKAKEREPTKELNEKRFDQDYQSIVRFYDDDTVGSALSKAQSDLPKMIKGANFFIGEHASRNARKFLDAIDDILDTKWSKAENDLAEARVLEPGPYAGAPNLPDTLFLSVVVNQALGQKTKALGDLTELYELHKKAPALWTDECRFFMIKRSIPDGYYQAAPAAPIERIRQSRTQ